MIIYRQVLVLLILLFSQRLWADPAFFEQKEWIRNQSQPPTTPYQQAAKQTREVDEKNREFNDDSAKLNSLPPQPLSSETEDDETDKEGY